MMLVPTVIIDRRGNVWSYQFGRLYADEHGTLRHMESIRR